MARAVISTEAELMAALRGEPMRRAVVAVEASGFSDYKLCVFEFDDGDPYRCAGHVGRFLYEIAEGSEAAGLLSLVQELSGEGGAKCLPLCCGPFCSTWVLREHPLARKARTCAN